MLTDDAYLMADQLASLNLIRRSDYSATVAELKRVIEQRYPPTKHTMTVQFSKEEFKQLADKASAQAISNAEFVRRAVRFYMQADVKEPVTEKQKAQRRMGQRE